MVAVRLRCNKTARFAFRTRPSSCIKRFYSIVVNNNPQICYIRTLKSKFTCRRSTVFCGNCSVFIQNIVRKALELCHVRLCGSKVNRFGNSHKDIGCFSVTLNRLSKSLNRRIGKSRINGICRRRNFSGSRELIGKNGGRIINCGSESRSV